MIVDCHTHINCPAHDVDPSEHLAAAETVDKCIVLAGVGESSQQVNEKLSKYVLKHKEKMVGFALAEPLKNKTTAKNLTTISEKLGLKGAVMYCCSCGFHPADTKAMRFYELAQELGVPVLFHNGEPFGPAAIRVCPALFAG